MRVLANNDIRQAAKERGVFLWEIAEYIKVSDPTMTRKLRHELPAAEKQKFLSIIDDIAASKTRKEPLRAAPLQ